MEVFPSIEEVEQLVRDYAGIVSVLGCYIFGSHLHGCSNAQSDVDLMVFVGGSYFLGCMSFDIEEKNLNVNIFHVKHIQDLLKQNMIWLVMLQWAPDRFVLRKYDFDIAVKLPSLRHAVLADASHNWAKAKRLWQEKDYYKSKKNIVHGLRWLLFGLQIIKDGRVSDFTAGNQYWFEIQANASLNYADYETLYRPLLKDLMHEVRNKDQLAQTTAISPLLPGGIPDGEVFSVVSQITKEIGITELSIDYSVKVNRLEGKDEDSGLFYLQQDPHNSPSEILFVSICNPLLIAQEKESEYKLVGRSYPVMKIFNEQHQKKLNINDVKISRKCDGKLAILYYWNSAWRIGTKLSADGSEVYNSHHSDILRITADFEPVEGQSQASREGWKKQMKRHSNTHMWRVRETEFGDSSLPEGWDGPQECFASLFWKVWGEKQYALPSSAENENENRCYLFDLVHPQTSQASKDEESRLILHGCYDALQDSFLDPEFIGNKFGWTHQSPVSFQSWDQVHLELNLLNPIQFNTAGFIIRHQNDWYRLLSPRFAALKGMHPFNDEFVNWKFMLDLIRIDDDHSCLDYFPHWRTLFEEVNASYGEFCSQIQSSFDSLLPLSDQEFAAQSNLLSYYGILFEMKKSKSRSAREYLRGVKLIYILNNMKALKDGRKRQKNKTKVI